MSQIVTPGFPPDGFEATFGTAREFNFPGPFGFLLAGNKRSIPCTSLAASRWKDSCKSKLSKPSLGVNSEQVHSPSPLQLLVLSSVYGICIVGREHFQAILNESRLGIPSAFKLRREIAQID